MGRGSWGGPGGGPGAPRAPRAPQDPPEMSRKSGRRGPTMAGGARRAPHPPRIRAPAGGGGGSPTPSSYARAGPSECRGFWGSVGVGDRNRSTAAGDLRMTRVTNGAGGIHWAPAEKKKFFFSRREIFFRRAGRPLHPVLGVSRHQGSRRT